MKYTMKAPCADCPFRTDVKPYLRRGRLREVGRLMVGDGTFTCHKSLREAGGDGKDMHCAGALLVVAKQEGTVWASGMLRIATRLGIATEEYVDHLDATAPTAPVYASFAAADRAQPR